MTNSFSLHSAEGQLVHDQHKQQAACYSKCVLRIKVNNFMQAFFHTMLLFHSTNLLKNCLVISCKGPLQVKLTPAIAYIVSHHSGASLMQAAQKPLCPNLINTLKGEPFVVLAKLLLFT